MTQRQIEIREALSSNMNTVQKVIQSMRQSGEGHQDTLFRNPNGLLHVLKWTDTMIDGIRKLRKMDIGNQTAVDMRNFFKSCAESLSESMEDIDQQMKMYRLKNASSTSRIFYEIEEVVSNAFYDVKELMNICKKDAEALRDAPKESEKPAFESASSIRKETITIAAQFYDEMAAKAGSIYTEMLRNRLNGLRGHFAMSQAIFNHDIEPEFKPFMGTYLIRSTDAVILEKIPERTMVFSPVHRITSQDELDRQNQAFKGKTVIYSQNAVIPFEQPDVDLAIKNAMEKSQLAILRHMDSHTPLPEGGLSVVLNANAGKAAPNVRYEPWQRTVITKHFPENSVLKWYPEGPFCYQLYRNKSNPEQIVLAAIRSDSTSVHILPKPSDTEMMDSSTTIEDLELLSLEESKKEWPHFGYHLPSEKVEDDTVFAGEMPTSHDSEEIAISVQDLTR